MSNNPISRPPLNQPMSQQTGKTSLAWSKWFELVFRQANRFSHIAMRAASATFTGRATNGEASLDQSFNLESVTRTAQGVYQGQLTSTTNYGVNLLSDCHGIITHTIAATGNTQAFQCDFSVDDDEAGTFSIRAYELVQGASVSIDRQLFDPVGVSDKINIIVLSSISDEDLIR